MKLAGEGPEQVVLTFQGGPEAVDLRQPFAALNFIIALRGIYPSRP